MAYNVPVNLDLSGLRGLRVPDVPDMLPLAVGWWIVLIFFFVMLIAFICGWHYIWFSPARQSVRAFKIMHKLADDRISYAREASKLMKRVAMFKFGREVVADLSGEEWAAFLIKHGGGAVTKEQAALVAQATYMPPMRGKKKSGRGLERSVKKWVKNVLKEK